MSELGFSQPGLVPCTLAPALGPGRGTARIVGLMAIKYYRVCMDHWSGYDTTVNYMFVTEYVRICELVGHPESSLHTEYIDTHTDSTSNASKCPRRQSRSEKNPRPKRCDALSCLGNKQQSNIPWSISPVQ
jgi:hypothetical protein